MTRLRDTVGGLYYLARFVLFGAPRRPPARPRRRVVCRHGWLVGPGHGACTAGCNPETAS